MKNYYPSNIKIKKIIFAIFFILLTSITFGQKKQVNLAIKNNNFSDYKYNAVLGTNNMINPKKLIKWFNKNKDKYCLLDYKLKYVWFAGTQRYLISDFSFVRVKDLANYNKLQVEKIKQAAIDAQKQAEIDKLFMPGAVAVFAVTISAAAVVLVGAYGGVNFSSNSSSTSSENTNNSKADKHITTIDYIETSNDKYIVHFQNKDTLGVKIIYNKEYSNSDYNAYDVQWYDKTNISNKVYYWLVSVGIGGADKNTWNACSRNFVNDCYIGVKETDVVKNYIKRYYLN